MKTKNIITVLLVAIILASCAPAAKVVPTETAIPTSTFTPVPIATITPTSNPTIDVEGQIVSNPYFSNPELFNLDNADSPIVQFANAFVVKPADVKLQNPQLLTSKDGQEFIVLTTSDIPDTKDIDETGIPLFIAVKNVNGEWVWSSSSLKNMCSLNGLKCGSTISGDEDYRNPLYNQKILHDFSIINSGGTSPQSFSRDGFQFENEYSLFAQQNGISFRPGHLFDWGDENPPELNTAPKAQITEWMNKWVQDVVNGHPYFDSINFANEPVGIYDGSQYWVSESNPWYRAYQEQWVVEAYAMIYRELEVKGLKPGEDVHLILNLPYGVKEWGYNPQFTIDFMADLKRKIQQKVRQDAKMDIGIQFHLRDVPQSQVDWGGPNINDLDGDNLVKFFQNLGEIGSIHITEMSVKNVQDPETAIKGVNLVLSSAIRSGTVKDVIFWEALKDNDFLFNAQFENNLDYYLVLQILLTNLEK
jgi:hypothetical protein